MKGRVKRLEKDEASRADKAGWEIWGSKKYMIFAVVKVYDLDNEVFIDIREKILDYYKVDKVYSTIFSNASESLVGRKVDVEKDNEGRYYIVDIDNYFN